MSLLIFEIEQSATSRLPLKESLFIRLATARAPATHQELMTRLNEASQRAQQMLEKRAIRARLESHSVTLKRAEAELASFHRRQELARDISLRQLNAYLIRNTKLACRSNNIHRHYAHMREKYIFRDIQDTVARKEMGERLQKRLAVAAARRSQALQGRVVRRTIVPPVKPIYNLLGPIIEVSSVSSFASISSMA